MTSQVVGIPLMKASKFVSILKKIATEQKTVYAWGMFGTPITKSTVTGKAEQYPNWYTDSKISSVFAPIYRSNSLVWGFDCVGLVKGVLWGWNGDSTKAYGGAVYASNGVPDISADAMINKCSNVLLLRRGCFLWMKGHCGVYIGNGQVVEATPQWNNGVQITDLNARKWTKYGKLPYIEYDVEDKVEEARKTVKIELTVLQKGSKGSEVKTLQRLLKTLTYKGKDGKVLAIDGDFGSNTDYSLRSYQQTKGLSVDGICGLYTWESLLK